MTCCLILTVQKWIGQMAPRKKVGLTTPETSNEYTPVKASTSCPDGQSPVIFSTKRRTETEALEESPSLGIFSPENKLACDIGWAWKSPIGRMGNTTKRRLMSKTPVPKTKRCTKANSPLPHFPTKRKLRKSEHLDTDHLSNLKSQLQALEGPCSLQENNAETTPDPATCCAPTKRNGVEHTSLTALLDDDNYFTLVQCSQYIEEKLIDNPDKIAFSPICIHSPARKIPRLNQTSTPKPNAQASTSFQAPEEKHPLTAKESHGKSLKNHRSLFHTEDTGSLSAENFSSKSSAITATNPTPNSDLSRVERLAQITEPLNSKVTSRKNVDAIFADDSYEDVLAHFCDENVELLSQGKMSLPQEESSNSAEPSISNQEKLTEYLSPSEEKTASTSQDLTRVTVEITAAGAIPSAETAYYFDDDFLQPDLLKMLEAIESKCSMSTEVQRVPSPPHQCTPDEIEKKRLEAKLKLEKKKRAAAVVKTNRLPGRSSLGNVPR